MEQNRFYHWVWRFNGIIIMIAGLLAIALLLFAGFSLYQDMTRERSVNNIVNVADSADVKEKWELGHLTQIRGTPFVMIPLKSEQNYDQSYYGKASSSARNYLFIHSKTNQKKWLLSSNDYLISDFELLTEQDFRSQEQQIRAILYRVVKQDSNQDQRLTVQDQQTIALSLPSGANYREIIADIDLFVGHHLVDENTLLLVYQKQGIGYSANVSLDGFELSHQEELPAINP